MLEDRFFKKRIISITPNHLSLEISLICKQAFQAETILERGLDFIANVSQPLYRYTGLKLELEELGIPY